MKKTGHKIRSMLTPNTKYKNNESLIDGRLLHPMENQDGRFGSVNTLN